MSRSLLLVYIFVLSSISTFSAVTTQTATGNANTLVHGKHNKVDNHSHTSDSPIHVRETKEYSSEQVKEDLAGGNYKGIKFEDKKKEKPSRKKVLILTGTNFETGNLHEAAQKAGLEIHKELLHDHVVYKIGSLGGVDIIHMQPGVMGMLEPGTTPLILMNVFRDLHPAFRNCGNPTRTWSASYFV